MQAACWSFTLYPEAGEGGGCFRSALRRDPAGGGVPDLERSRQEAARRARTKLRRYCAANRLNRLGTLTYAASCVDQQQLREDQLPPWEPLCQQLGARQPPHRPEHPLRSGSRLGRPQPAFRRGTPCKPASFRRETTKPASHAQAPLGRPLTRRDTEDSSNERKPLLRNSFVSAARQAIRPPTGARVSRSRDQGFATATRVEAITPTRRCSTPSRHCPSPDTHAGRETAVQSPQVTA